MNYADEKGENMAKEERSRNALANICLGPFYKVYK